MSDNSFADQLTKAMGQYSEDVSKAIEDSLTSVAEEACERLHSTSPRRTGKYARGWRTSKYVGDGKISFIVHQNKKNAPLTHLLENGHRHSSSGKNIDYYNKSSRDLQYGEPNLLYDYKRILYLRSG